MARYYITSNSVQAIILAKSEAAAKMLFQIGHPGNNIDLCLKMVA